MKIIKNNRVLKKAPFVQLGCPWPKNKKILKISRAHKIKKTNKFIIGGRLNCK
jgi:hypothetical protein